MPNTFLPKWRNFFKSGHADSQAKMHQTVSLDDKHILGQRRSGHSPDVDSSSNVFIIFKRSYPRCFWDRTKMKWIGLRMIDILRKHLASKWPALRIQPRISVTRFGKILPLWHNLKVLGKFLRVYLVFAKMLILLWQKCYAIGQVLIVVDSPYTLK